MTHCRNLVIDMDIGERLLEKIRLPEKIMLGNFTEKLVFLFTNSN